jgi:arsenical-resistance protein 2
MPAQTIYHSLPTLYALCDAAKIDIVIWYCGNSLNGRFQVLDTLAILTFTGSSRGRGTRAAGWFDDLIKDNGNASMKSVFLLEGIKGWASAGGEYVEMIDGFDAQAWLK